MFNDTSDAINPGGVPVEEIEHKSQFKLKSIGYAASNKELNSKMLEVVPIEEFGYIDGEINDNRDKITESVIDPYGNTTDIEIETSNAIQAEWLPWGNHRNMPPDVRRGERVLLWQYADVDKFYWTSTGLDDNLRALETVTWMFSDTKDENKERLDSTNAWVMHLSTHQKEITLQTTKSDGEPFFYIARFDLKTGNFLITDDVGNQISIISSSKTITLVNSAGSTVELAGPTINIKAPQTINMEASTVNIKGVTNVTGKTTIKGNTSINGETSISKKTTMSGGMSVSGGGSISGRLTNNGVNVGSTHVHDGVETGRGTTRTPR